jgi:hypothetical protein
MGRITLEATGGYDWPALPAPSVWERLGGWGPRRRLLRQRRDREQRDWQAAIHAAALLDAVPRVTRGRLLVDQSAAELRYEVFLGVLALRGALPLADVAGWDAARWQAWCARLVGPPDGQAPED